MTEVNVAIAAERLNKQIQELPAQFREGFRDIVRNTHQSGYSVGTIPPRGKEDRVRLFTEREPFLRAVQGDLTLLDGLRLRAGRELIEGERLLREVFG